MPLRERPRVAIIAPGPAIIGGQGIQARALLAALRADGYPVSFIPIDPDFPLGLGWLRQLRYARTALNQALYLPALIGLRRADVAHVFAASYWSFLLAPAPAILAARCLGRRVVLHYHSGEADDHLARWGASVRPWLDIADAIVVPSEYLRNVFVHHGYAARVIPNIVDSLAFRFRERGRLRPRLLSVRNLEPHYGVDRILRAFAIVIRRRPDATLTVAGYGSAERDLRRLATSLCRSGVRFVGRVEPPAMPALYDGADVLLNASVVDNQPLSILEAQLAGLPVVSTPTGDLARMVRNRETGLVVPADDPEAMAEAVMTLLEDPQLARGVAARARSEAAAYSWSRVRAAWAGVYEGEAA